MKFKLNDIVLPDWDVGDRIDGITYRWSTIEDKDSILDLVNRTNSSFIPYYTDDVKVLIALDDNKIVGSTIVDFNGSIGNIVVDKDYLGKSIGNNMIALGTRLLKKSGLEESCIGYTYQIKD